ncbi:MAG: elongation factor P [Bdellovibrionales bacterium]|nr:elongation factor P [Bdellovibrionales bacterium]
MASVYPTNEFKKGVKLEIDNNPFQIVEFQHVSPGKGSAFTRTKLKNLLTGNVIERTFKSGDKVPAADVDLKEMQYLYKDAEGYHFMNTENYEQIRLNPEQIGENANYMMDNMQVQVMIYNGLPVSVELPTFVELVVKETAPSFRGDTVTGGTKPATMETGCVVNVPFHISEGDKLRIDTRDNAYVEKVNK